MSDKKETLKEWTKSDVEKWFRGNENFAEFFPKFQGLNGSGLAVLPKGDIQNVLGIIKGSALYETIQELKGEDKKEKLEGVDVVTRLSVSIEQLKEQLQLMESLRRSSQDPNPTRTQNELEELNSLDINV